MYLALYFLCKKYLLTVQDLLARQFDTITFITIMCVAYQTVLGTFMFKKLLKIHNVSISTGSQMYYFARFCIKTGYFF